MSMNFQIGTFAKTSGSRGPIFVKIGYRGTYCMYM